MPYIIPNNLLTPSEKVIKPYNCSFIAVDGPQIKSKLNMEGLEIPYISQYTSTLVLNEESSDQPVLYGFLGNNITFLMIKATYVPKDPNWAVEADEYIEYYFADNPSQKRYMSKLLVLTGNSAKRIPQIYLTNPSTKNKVYLEVFMANLDQDSLDSTSGTIDNIDYINGLYFNNIISDRVLSGSTSLYITDEDDNTILIIPYENINTIQRLSDGLTLLIGTDSEEKIKLEFLSAFNMKQAHSRINWVLEDTTNRYLTKTYPNIDADPPTITWTTLGSQTGYTSITTGNTTYLIDTFISGVTDTRDGNISIYDTNVVIYNEGSLVPLSGITTEGQYQLLFTVADIAGNSNTQTKYAMYDVTSPIIKFRNVASGSTFSMSISGNTSSGTYITSGDTLTYTVASVTDNVYSGLTLADVNIVLSGDTCYPCTSITTSGESYTVIYSLSDYLGNTSTYQKTINTLS